MHIRQEIAEKHWLIAAIEETALKYATQGYEVTYDAVIEGTRADLVVRKGNELIVIEFKLGNWSDQRSDEVRRLRNAVVHNLGGRFNLVVVTPPKEKDIKIDGIEDILYTIVLEDLGKLDELSTHTYVDAVSNVTITSVVLDQNQTQIKGTGIVSVELNWGSNFDRDNNNGSTITDSFPFDFSIILDKDLHVVEIEELKIDTSSYYE